MSKLDAYLVNVNFIIMKIWNWYDFSERVNFAIRGSDLLLRIMFGKICIGNNNLFTVFLF